jgi:hypothetical protein
MNLALPPQLAKWDPGALRNQYLCSCHYHLHDAWLPQVVASCGRELPYKVCQRCAIYPDALHSFPPESRRAFFGLGYALSASLEKGRMK